MDLRKIIPIVFIYRCTYKVSDTILKVYFSTQIYFYAQNLIEGIQEPTGT